MTSKDFAPSSSLVVSGVLLLVFGQFICILGATAGAAVVLGAITALAGLVTLLIGLKQLAMNVDIAAQVAAAQLDRNDVEPSV
jgi:hypothetical protein